MSPYLELAIATLQDLRDDIHQRANRQFFQSRVVSYGDLLQQEATVRNALQLIEALAHKNPVPFEGNCDAEVAC